jgi:RAB protein geranylgeranyltransferase component A
MKEAMETMTSSIIETQECIQMERIYDHVYSKMEKNRLKKELKDKKIKKENESLKSKKNGMKFLRWIINFISTKEVGKHS